MLKDLDLIFLSLFPYFVPAGRPLQRRGDHSFGIYWVILYLLFNLVFDQEQFG